ncbi:hypothetical protein Tco_1374604 [Tanacetum coccineum]
MRTLTNMLSESWILLACLTFLEYHKMKLRYAYSHSHLLEHLKYGWTDSLQEPLTPGNSLKKPLSKGIFHHPKPQNSLKTIYNFKQEGDKSLYQACERYNDLLYKCPTYDINSQKGLIPSMTPAQALTAIQTMAYHSQKWHDNSSSRNIGGSNNTDGLAAIVSKLDNLGRDMKKFKENGHAIPVGC